MYLIRQQTSVIAVSQPLQNPVGKVSSETYTSDRSSIPTAGAGSSFPYDLYDLCDLYDLASRRRVGAV